MLLVQPPLCWTLLNSDSDHGRDLQMDPCGGIPSSHETIVGLNYLRQLASRWAAVAQDPVGSIFSIITSVKPEFSMDIVLITLIKTHGRAGMEGVPPSSCSLISQMLSVLRVWYPSELIPGIGLSYCNVSLPSSRDSSMGMGWGLWLLSRPLLCVMSLEFDAVSSLVQQLHKTTGVR